MIDTIVLMIEKGNYTVMDHSKFTPSTQGLFDKSNSGFGAKLYAKYIQNPPKNGPYGPRLTIYTRKSGEVLQIPLRIEFSIPKLLYGDNVNEVCEADFNTVIKKLQERLKAMGVWVRAECLEEAAVSNVHFSKNIPLSGGYTSSFAINELSKLDVSGKLDINKTHFRNQGLAIYFYAKSYSIVFYDKMNDIIVPKGRAVDSDKTEKQLSLFEDYKARIIPEILRLEARLTDKRKMNSLLKELGFKENPTFKEIFSEKISQAVLQHYWKFIGTDKYAFLLKFQEEKPDRLLKIILNHKKRPTKESLALLGTALFVIEHGIRPFKKAIIARYTYRTWLRRLEEEIAELNEIFKNGVPFGFVKDVESTLMEFKPFRLDNVNQSKL